MDQTAAELTHDLLLDMAGRVDDDLLAWARELVAVGETQRAVELIGATLVAERAALPGPVRAALVRAARTAATELDADGSLAGASPRPEDTAHRFDSGPAPEVAAAVRALPDRLLDGCRVLLARRLTPAGSAPGPLPHPVVLVEIAPGSRDRDVLSYQVADALRRAGAHASVEVIYVDQQPLPAYHGAAMRSAEPIRPDGPGGGAVEPGTGRGPGAHPLRAPTGAEPAAALPVRSTGQRVPALADWELADWELADWELADWELADRERTDGVSADEPRIESGRTEPAVTGLPAWVRPDPDADTVPAGAGLREPRPADPSRSEREAVEPAGSGPSDPEANEADANETGANETQGSGPSASESNASEPNASEPRTAGSPGSLAEPTELRPAPRPIPTGRAPRPSTDRASRSGPATSGVRLVPSGDPQVGAAGAPGRTPEPEPDRDATPVRAELAPGQRSDPATPPEPVPVVPAAELPVRDRRHHLTERPAWPGPAAARGSGSAAPERPAAPRAESGNTEPLPIRGPDDSATPGSRPADRLALPAGADGGEPEAGRADTPTRGNPARSGSGPGSCGGSGELGLRPESVARLSASGRELLARLQAELQGGGPAGGPRAGGVTPNGGGHGTGPQAKVDPPNLAG